MEQNIDETILLLKFVAIHYLFQEILSEREKTYG